MKTIISIAAVAAIALGILSYTELNHPRSDPTFRTVCVASHKKSYLTVGTGGGIPIGSNLEMHIETICDKEVVQRCVEWEVDETWVFHKVYQICTVYQ